MNADAVSKCLENTKGPAKALSEQNAMNKVNSCILSIQL